MVQITKYINGPYQGVSQVAPQDALEDSCRAMVDCWPILPQGIIPRPPLEWLAQLDLGDQTVAADHVLHHIPLGSDTDDLLLVLDRNDSASVAAYLYAYDDLTPVSLTVTTAAQDYLDAGTGAPLQQFQVASIEDTTFIVNRSVTVALTSDTSTSRPYEAVVWVKSGGYNRVYSVTVTPASGTPVTATYTPATGANANDAKGVNTDRIAQGLYDGTVVSGSAATVSAAHLDDLASQGFTVELHGPVIYIKHATVDFTLDVKDDAGGTAMVGLKGSVQRFSDLPAAAVDGFTIKVAQEAVGGNSDYWVQFDASNTATSGVWKEVVKPDTNLGIDSATMPIGLKKVAGVWTLDVLTWGQRTTGDTETSPDPDFVGYPIQKLGWFRGRLLLLYSAGAYLSATDDPFKFYTTTLATALDSDPVGTLNPADHKVFFKDVAIMQRSAVLFATGAEGGLQTAISAPGEGPVSASNFRHDVLSESPYYDGVPVQRAFNKLYYTAPQGNNLVVYEMALDRISGEIQPELLSGAVPYLLGSTISRAATNQLQYTSLYVHPTLHQIVVHSYRYSEQQRVQNAFYVWTMPPGYTPGGIVIKGASVTLILYDNAGEAHVCRMDMSPIPSAGGLPEVRQHLDLRVTSSSGVYDSATNSTTFTLSVPLSLNVVAALAEGTDGYPEGFLPTVLGVNAGAGTVTIEGDATGDTLYFGRPYLPYFTPHTFFARDPQGKVRSDGRLTIRSVKAQVAQFSGLTITVRQSGRGDKVVHYDGVFATDPESGLDVTPVKEHATLYAPVGGQNKEVTIIFAGVSHLGFQFMGYEWRGHFNTQATRT